MRQWTEAPPAAPPMKTSPRSSLGDEMGQVSFMGTLVLLFVTLNGAVRGTSLALPHPSNVSYTLNETRCQLDVVWTPVKMERPCDVKYWTAIRTGGDWVKVQITRKHSRTVQVPLGKEVVFGVRTECLEQKGEWFNISLPQNGVPGTGAVNISCVWHINRYLECSWLRGENASRDTSYNLTSWIPVLKEEQPCTNYTKRADAFRCAFDLKYDWPKPISISIQGNSKDIQPVCILSEVSREGRFPVRLNTPIVNITKNNGGVFLNWTKPDPWNGMSYEVETNNSGSEVQQTRNTNISISLKPKARHTFRVRALFYDSGEAWTSDWSNMVDWDERDHTLYILYILAPLCVAVLTVVFLIYRKQIKEKILPTIPEPRNFLEQMLDEESKDYLNVKSAPN